MAADPESYLNLERGSQWEQPKEWAKTNPAATAPVDSADLIV